VLFNISRGNLRVSEMDDKDWKAVAVINIVAIIVIMLLIIISSFFPINFSNPPSPNTLNVNSEIYSINQSMEKYSILMNNTYTPFYRWANDNYLPTGNITIPVVVNSIWYNTSFNESIPVIFGPNLPNGIPLAVVTIQNRTILNFRASITIVWGQLSKITGEINVTLCAKNLTSEQRTILTNQKNIIEGSWMDILAFDDGYILSPYLQC
jgi:hypothetical protein